MHKSRLRYTVFIVLFTLVAFELLLRLASHNTTYSEQTGQGYKSAYNQKMPTWFYTRTPHSSFEVSNSDFKYQYNTNALGLRDTADVFNDTAGIRIICLGDSYTEGYGAPADSTWPALLHGILQRQGLKNQVINAGIAGSDPFYEYALFSSKLLPLHPTHLLICINATDFKDYMIRGGAERFKTDSTTACRPGPWFEPLYHYSYTARFIINDIMGYADANLFVKKKDKQKLTARANVAILQTLEKLNTLCRQNACRLEVIIQPDILNYVNTDDESRMEEDTFNGLTDWLRQRQVTVVNLYPALAHFFNPANYLRYSYPHDSHYNSTGYQILAGQIAAQTPITFWAYPDNF